MELADGVRPSLEGLEASGLEPSDSAAVQNWLAEAEVINPRLRKVNAEVRSADAMRRLTAQQLIPFAEAGVYALGERGETVPVIDRVDTG